MKKRILGRSGNARNMVVLWASFLAVFSFLIVGASSAQQPQESRPRSTSATPTSTPPQTAQPSPAQTGPGRRIAPQLGQPPPAPILQPKPTPTPDPTTAETDAGSRLA